MKADLDRAVMLACAAHAFDWTWKKDDIRRFCEEMGWTVVSKRGMGATIATDLEVDKPLALAQFDRQLLSQLGADGQDVLKLSVRITDLLNEELAARSASQLSSVFAEVGERLVSAFGGDRMLRVDGLETMTWQFDNVVIELLALDIFISITIFNPGFYRFLQEDSAD